MRMMIQACLVFLGGGAIALAAYVGTKEALHAFELRELRHTYGVQWGGKGWEVAELGNHSHGVVLSSGVRSGRMYCAGSYSQTGPTVPIIETYGGKRYTVWPSWLEHPYWRLAEIFDVSWCDGKMPHTHISKSFNAPLLQTRN